MSILSAIPIIGNIFDKAVNVIDKIVPDKDLAQKLRQEHELTFTRINHTEFIEGLKAQTQLVLGEIQGQSWLQRNWRPILMLATVAIVVNNYIVYPYLSLFGAPSVILELPDELWQLMKIGVGGYMVGRSAEKIAEVKWGGHVEKTTMVKR